LLRGAGARKPVLPAKCHKPVDDRFHHGGTVGVGVALKGCEPKLPGLIYTGTEDGPHGIPARRAEALHPIFEHSY